MQQKLEKTLIKYLENGMNKMALLIIEYQIDLGFSMAKGRRTSNHHIDTHTNCNDYTWIVAAAAQSKCSIID